MDLAAEVVDSVAALRALGDRQGMGCVAHMRVAGACRIEPKERVVAAHRIRNCVRGWRPAVIAETHEQHRYRG